MAYILAGIIGIVLGVCWKLPLIALLNILEWLYPEPESWPCAREGSIFYHPK